MGLGAAAGSLIAPSGSRPADFDSMQQKGEFLVVLVSLSPFCTVLEDGSRLHPADRIQVEYQSCPSSSSARRCPSDGRQVAHVDAFATSLHVEKLLFSQAGSFEPLNRYLEDPT